MRSGERGKDNAIQSERRWVIKPSRQRTSLLPIVWVATLVKGNPMPTKRLSLTWTTRLCPERFALGRPATRSRTCLKRPRTLAVWL